MMKTRRILAVAVLAGLLAAPALAAVYTVNQGGGGDYTTVEEAFFATTGDGVDDTILITDSATYTIPLQADMPSVAGNTGGLAEMDLLDGDGSLIVQADTGQTPTIQTSVGGHRIFRNLSTTGQVLTVQGASETDRMTLITNSGRPVINAGPAGGNGLFALSNLIITKDTTTDPTGAWLQVNDDATGTHTLANITFTGGNPAVASPNAVLVLGNVSAGSNVPTINADNLDFSQVGAGYDSGAGGCIAIQLYGRGNITISNSTLEPPTGVGGPGLAITRYAMAGTSAGLNIEFVDCSFSSGGGGGYYRAFDGLGDNAQLPTLNSYTLTDPVFAGGLGDVAFAAESSVANFTVRGTDPANKVDFNALAAGGTVLVARTLGGTWTFENCTDSTGFPAGLIDCASGSNPLVADVNVVQNQCTWLDGRSGDFIGADGGASAFSTNFTATNTIWAGTTNQGHVLAAIGSHTGQSVISLTHCTIAKNTGNALFFGNAGDTVQIDGCIIYTTQISASHALSSIAVNVGPAAIPSLVYVNDPDDGSGNPYVGKAGLPAFIMADPLLDAQGRISSANSPALGGARGSALAVDVDGGARPQGDSIADIGAAESALVGPWIIENVVSNGDPTRANRYARTVFNAGSLVHIERPLRIIGSMPAYLNGTQGITTSHSDRDQTVDLISFDLLEEAAVYVAWDSRCTEATWLVDQGWTMLPDVINMIDDPDAPTRQIWMKTFPAGNVVLGPPNCGGRSNYFVLVNIVEEVPSVVVPGNWLTLQEAIDAIEAAGFVVGNVIEQSSNSVLPGFVIGQVPGGGTSLPPGSAIDIILSTGAPRGMPIPAAGLLSLASLAILGALGGAIAVRRRVS